MPDDATTAVGVVSGDGSTPPSDAGEPQLRLDGISVRFGGITALDQVSMDAHAGEVLGIIGPNGAGKTTLFDVVSGVRAPNEGRVVLAGRDLTRVSASGRARRGLRRTFQRVQTFGWLSVEDNVLAALEWRGGGGGFLGDLVYAPTRKRRERDRRARVEEVLDRCGLLPVRKELAGSLPIGDETEVRRLGAEIQAVRAEAGCAVLLVEHNAGFVMEQSDRVVVLNLGQVLAAGSPAEVQRNQAVRDAYLGEQDAGPDSLGDDAAGDQPAP
jgi:branched-chain amino acid transport system ATP-binding protein